MTDFIKDRLPAFSCAIVCLLFLLAGCAGQQAPEGGPVDTVPPEIASVYPAPNTVNFKDSRIAIEFSEYVDRSSVEKAVFISPFVSDIEYAWSGREVEIIIHGGLKANTTYVLTLGTDVVDYNNHNRLAAAFTLAFSTGNVIDRGAIEGHVYDDKPEGVMIFAYRLNDIRPDTLNPAVTKPDYITQTGASGTFALSHLAFGTYRVFAVRDEYRDLVYTPEVDAVGTLTKDLVVSERDTLSSGAAFTLALEDTSAPRLLSAEARDVRHVILKFSEAIDTSMAPGLSRAISITDTLSGRALDVTEAFIENPQTALSMTVCTKEQIRDAGYRVSVTAVRDRALHPIAPSASSLVFRGSDRPDTLAPVLIAGSMRDTLSHIELDDHFRFDFSDALKPSVLHVFSIRLGDSLDVPGTIARPTISGVVLTPNAPLLPKSRYSITIRYDSVRSLTSGSALKDSVRTVRYTTIDPENFSSLEGRIDSPVLSDTAVTIVEAFNTADKTAVVRRSVATKDRTFSFQRLAEGMYRLRAFSDMNNNGVLDAGRPFPFRYSEPFVVGRDTVKVRARWPVEGVVINSR
ncbi:MAG TPA: Ig-like domain-containing protein [Bacteroidota bacterium]|nr:Ig-like domain-containing protein [Bacteroidota bacterium]